MMINTLLMSTGCDKKNAKQYHEILKLIILFSLDE